MASAAAPAAGADVDTAAVPPSRPAFVEQGRSPVLEKAILDALKDEYRQGKAKGRGARRRAIRRFRKLTGHKGDVNSVAFDAQHIVSGSRDKTIKVWDRETGALVHTLTGHGDWVTSVALDGQHIVSGSEDKTIKVWRRPASDLASVGSMALQCAHTPLDVHFPALANQILLWGLAGLDAALCILLSTPPIDHDKLFLCHHVVSNPAAAPLVSILARFLGRPLADLVDPYTGRTVYESSAKPVKRAFDEQIELLGRYRAQPGIPAYASATCIVVKAEDLAGGAIDSEDDGGDSSSSNRVSVVLKFMKDPRTFAKEVESRTLDLDPSAVMPLVASYSEDDLRAAVARHDDRRFDGFPCMVALPFADRNLEQIYQSERLSFGASSVLLREIVENVAKMHEKGLVHGDIKPKK